MPALNQTVWQQLLDKTPEDAATYLTQAHQGDASGAQRDVWDTWHLIVGGQPGQRTQEGVDAPEAKFCMAIVRAMEDARFAKREKVA